MCWFLCKNVKHNEDRVEDRRNKFHAKTDKKINCYLVWLYRENKNIGMFNIGINDILIVNGINLQQFFKIV